MPQIWVFRTFTKQKGLCCFSSIRLPLYLDKDLWNTATCSKLLCETSYFIFSPSRYQSRYLQCILTLCTTYCYDFSHCFCKSSKKEEIHFVNASKFDHSSSVAISVHFKFWNLMFCSLVWKHSLFLDFSQPSFNVLRISLLCFFKGVWPRCGKSFYPDIEACLVNFLFIYLCETGWLPWKSF